MLIELIRQKKYDVMLVQETHNDVQNESDWKMEWDGEVILSHNSSYSGGVAVLFKNILNLYHMRLKTLLKGNS